MRIIGVTFHQTMNALVSQNIKGTNDRPGVPLLVHDEDPHDAVKARLSTVLRDAKIRPTRFQQKAVCGIASSAQKFALASAIPSMALTLLGFGGCWRLSTRDGSTRLLSLSYPKQKSEHPYGQHFPGGTHR